MSDIDAASYGETSAGALVRQYTLRNASGMVVRFLDYGGTLTEISVPDRAGSFANVALGCRNIADYETRSPYFGALVGRYANRIAGARFILDGEPCHLAANNGPNTLHGGMAGGVVQGSGDPKDRGKRNEGGATPNFSHRIWDVVSAGPNAATLRLVSADGDNGFPGTLTLEVTYTLDEANALRIDYAARVEGRATVLNPTSHCYFNLAGNGAGSALDHVATIYAGRYLPTDAGQIPTGAIEKVDGTPMDFRAGKRIGADIRAGFEQLALAGGYDHCYVLDKPEGALGLAARAHDPVSGRTLAIETTEPGVQFYTGNKLDGTIIGSGGALYRQGDGFAFETQHFPDSPNQPQFPSTRLDPGVEFRSTTIWRFGVSS
ncbi:galactose mutarotase [Acidiphilium sp. AL]|uniref:Aldose 1-epimerase n=1 Tax=Acidiphilium iwatense TaxID=768198 RepID=A0ABS9DWG1_9PROT|nr:MULTISPECIES: aldose epimerase family protein [Acidiphilium]MCF3946473.1 galactose mutarotase [Acidiphilium iwatense]MCU4158643.1 galactose mutarotase [Acidiphilium sp. AL]